MRKARRGTHWSEADIALLESRWGCMSIDRLADKLRRTPCAVALKARSLALGQACAGMTTMRQMEQASGYDRSRIVGIAARLGLRLRRAPRMSERAPTRSDALHRRIVFSDEQRANILACIAQTTHIPKVWSNRGRNTERTAWGTGRKPTSCSGCGLTENPHKANGECSKCYRPAKRKKQNGTRSRKQQDTRTD